VGRGCGHVVRACDDVIGGGGGRGETGRFSREASVRRQAEEEPVQPADSTRRQRLRLAGRPRRTSAHQHHRRRKTILYTWGDCDVISMPAGFRRHLVGKTLRNVFTVMSLKNALLAS